jgi:hypothetical protein
LDVTHGNRAEPKRIVLVDPGVVARLGAVLADTLEAGAGVLVKCPALRAVIAGGFDPGSSRTTAAVSAKTPTVPQTDPSMGLGITA